MKIGPVEIGGGRVYVIAEAGVNHNGDIALARKLIDAAKGAGADAVKFQTFTVDEIVTEHAKQADYQAENSGITESQASMLQKLALSHGEFSDLKTYADRIGIEFLSTPFSIPDADFLHSLQLAAYKVSSGDLTNLPLLRHLASFAKPILLSTGMATLDEVRESFGTLAEGGAKDIVLLQCTSEYPTPLSHVNLRVLQTLKDTFKVPIGYSDHTLGLDAAIAAASEDAAIIEKHLTLDKGLPGPDHKASLGPDELKEMIVKIRVTAPHSLQVSEEILGSPQKQPTREELATAKLVRKGIAARKDVEQGEVLTETNMFITRPEGLILPKEWNNVLGKHAKVDILGGTSLSWEMIE